MLIPFQSTHTERCWSEWLQYNDSSTHNTITYVHWLMEFPPRVQTLQHCQWKNLKNHIIPLSHWTLLISNQKLCCPNHKFDSCIYWPYHEVGDFFISVQFVKWPRDESRQIMGRNLASSWNWHFHKYATFTMFNSLTTTDQLSLLVAFTILAISICACGTGEANTHK